MQRQNWQSFIFTDVHWIINCNFTSLLWFPSHPSCRTFNVILLVLLKVPSPSTSTDNFNSVRLFASLWSQTLICCLIFSITSSRINLSRPLIFFSGQNSFLCFYTEGKVTIKIVLESLNITTTLNFMRMVWSIKVTVFKFFGFVQFYLFLIPTTFSSSYCFHQMDEQTTHPFIWCVLTAYRQRNDLVAALLIRMLLWCTRMSAWSWRCVRGERITLPSVLTMINGLGLGLDLLLC